MIMFQYHTNRYVNFHIIILYLLYFRHFFFFFICIYSYFVDNLFSCGFRLYNPYLFIYLFLLFSLLILLKLFVVALSFSHKIFKLYSEGYFEINLINCILSNLCEINIIVYMPIVQYFFFY